MPKGIATTERAEVPPSADVHWIGLKAAATGSTRDGRPLSAADGQQVAKLVWLLKHGSGPPGAERES